MSTFLRHQQASPPAIAEQLISQASSVNMVSMPSLREALQAPFPSRAVLSANCKQPLSVINGVTDPDASGGIINVPHTAAVNITCNDGFQICLGAAQPPNCLANTRVMYVFRAMEFALLF